MVLMLLSILLLCIMCFRYPSASDDGESHRQPTPNKRCWQAVTGCSDFIFGVLPCCGVPLHTETESLHFPSDAGKVSVILKDNFSKQNKKIFYLVLTVTTYSLKS